MAPWVKMVPRKYENLSLNCSILVKAGIRAPASVSHHLPIARREMGTGEALKVSLTYAVEEQQILSQTR